MKTSPHQDDFVKVAHELPHSQNYSGGAALGSSKLSPATVLPNTLHSLSPACRLFSKSMHRSEQNQGTVISHQKHSWLDYIIFLLPGIGPGILELSVEVSILNKWIDGKKGTPKTLSSPDILWIPTYYAGFKND